MYQTNLKTPINQEILDMINERKQKNNGIVENIGEQIYRLTIKLELPLNWYFLWAEWKPTSMLSEKIVVWRSS